MAVTVKRLIYPTASTASGTAAKYIKSFDLIDWTLSGSDYVITVTEAIHGLGVNPVTTVYYDNVGTFEEVEVDVSVDANGDVNVRVTSSPDNRFKGKLTIF